MDSVIVLGSTGSIGTQTLELIADRPDQYRVAALAASGSRPAELAHQILQHRPATVALSHPSAIQDVQLALYAAVKDQGWNAGEVKLPRIIGGPDAVAEVAAYECDTVVNAITGSAGLVPTLTTLAAGTRLALANKESLVIGGRLVTDAAAPGQLVAVDSEHSAIAQCLRAGRAEEVRRVVVTASGGPFRGWDAERLLTVTPQQAMKHPTWAMGRVITINSATLVNKALEVLEAALLYGLDLEQVDTVAHPQSIVHSMVEFHDGSTMAQCSPPDMKLPIGLALGWPDRMADAAQPLDWTRATSWTFEPIDHDVFPAIRLIREAYAAGGTAPGVYNAANEVAVDAFCDGKLTFPGIVETIQRVLEVHVDSPDHIASPDLEQVLAADGAARVLAADLIGERR
ncbi:1-deoxy-D-xylulose-5-phosphate reductoisomerase [Parenemella sanctibonifatiensis]|uniref:1-deoxy-D-xylulose 5-phosphate reductoisomerase n=1 Tax=Parenemella sanctibonifatiensis TaxID=2016505 RepID=A0A255EFD2_9ACTN|nr:1-deoxy-D-xylulose-5-phosphate reductoisomerase [Parenemella sanctibonifatiensis]OYN89960.1 1-deoxy-D-xylulose-5-phosphate reductoisomerase [Parenemella sanctibonifatiensis]